MDDTYSPDLFRQCTGQPLAVCVSGYEASSNRRLTAKRAGGRREGLRSPLAARPRPSTLTRKPGWF